MLYLLIWHIPKCYNCDILDSIYSSKIYSEKGSLYWAWKAKESNHNLCILHAYKCLYYFDTKKQIGSEIFELY